MGAILTASSLLRADERHPTPAEPVVVMGPNDFAYLDDIPPLEMPLVDPAAMDNSAEDIIRHYAHTATEENPAAFYILVDYENDEYDRTAGRLLAPSSFLSLLGYIVPQKHKYVARAKNGHKLFGKYQLYRWREGGAHEYYMLYVSKRLIDGKWTISWRLTY
jgi:hypothetical protein